MSKIQFVNLHHHSTFSYGDGFGTPLQHVERAAELGYTAITLTEHGGVSSHFQLEKAALKAGIKPVFGLEGYCGTTDPKRRSQYKNHLTIIAKDADGYRNLNRIVTQSWVDYYYHPTISGRSLAANRSGIVVLSGCTGSLLACTLTGGKGIPEPEKPDMRAAGEVIERFLQVFGDDYYLEVQPFYELEKTCLINPAYEKLGKEYGVRLVVTHDAHYPRMSDGEMQAVLHAVHRGKASVDDAMREWNYAVPLTLPESDRELADRLQRTGMSKNAVSDAIQASADVADQCKVTLPKAERLQYPVSEQDFRPWNLLLTVLHVDLRRVLTGSRCARMPGYRKGIRWRKSRSQ